MGLSDLPSKPPQSRIRIRLLIPIFLFTNGPVEKFNGATKTLLPVHPQVCCRIFLYSSTLYYFSAVKRNLEEHLEAIKHRFETGVHDTFQKVVNASRKAVDNAKAAIQENKAVDNVVHAAGKDIKDDIDKVVHKAENETQKVVHKVEGDIKKDVSDVDNDVHKAEVDIPKYFHDVVNATEHPKATLESAVNEAKKLLNFTKTIHFSPKLDGRNITLLKETWNCHRDRVFPGVQVDLSPWGYFNGSAGVAVSGFLYPPHVASYQIIASERLYFPQDTYELRSWTTGLKADVSAVLTIVAELTVKFDSGQHKIFEFPLAGIEFPG